MNKVIYIAGPMSGYPNFNREAFFKAEARLKSAGFVVINPAILPDGLEHDQYLEIGIAMLAPCNCIYMLHGHQDSKGAKSELSFAKNFKYKIYSEDSGDFVKASSELMSISSMVTDGIRMQTFSHKMPPAVVEYLLTE